MADVRFDDFSRRGLINAATDFDKENDGAIKKFIQAKETTREGTYEHIRPIESVIVKVDDMGGTVGKVIKGNLDKIFTDIEKGIPGAVEKVTEYFLNAAEV